MKRAILTIVIVFVMGLALSWTTSAQQPSNNQTRGGSMQMGGMMEECQKHCLATSNSIDRLNKMMEDARRSNDASKMRLALENAQKPLTEMKNHMSSCMSMMKMMGGMQGGAMGNQQKPAEPKR